MTHCEIREYRNPWEHLGRVLFALDGYDYLKPNIVAAYDSGASLNDVAALASALIGRKVKAVISYGTLCIIAEFVDAEDVDLAHLTDAELAAVIRWRLVLYRSVTRDGDENDEALFSLGEAENEHHRRFIA